MAAALRIGFIALAAFLAVGFSSAQDLSTNCVVCDSTQNANCLFRPEMMPSTVCPGLVAGTNARCFTRLNLVGATLRGCLENDLAFNECTANTTCLNCQNIAAAQGTVQGICNRFTQVPEARPRCHTCEGPRFGLCGAQPAANETQVCPLHDGNETRCFTRRSERLITRGCRSNTTFCSDELQCLSCLGHGCNSLSHLDNHIPWASSASMLQLAPLLVIGSAALALAKKL